MLQKFTALTGLLVRVLLPVFPRYLIVNLVINLVLQILWEVLLNMFFCSTFLLQLNSKALCQTRNETPQLARGAAKAVFELYEVVTHDLLSSDLRYDS